ncbi:MAG: YbaB/EbfC family nucleoid-associated protein [Spirochaetaceae bacterium]|jgi:DNA-binding YbaB/EbfC family protein|nr:YbaB/EbfC family nucleoid-associated protein [Spirochaetaceae bacterium]
MTINPLDIMKNAQKIQEQMGVMQEKLANVTVRGSAGAGMVEVEMNGKLELVNITISPDIVAENDAAMLEDLVQAAFNVATEKARNAAAKEMSAMTGGINIPGLLQGMPNVNL